MLDDFRPIRWWLPELMNRMRFPRAIATSWRRSEVADMFKQARRDGVHVSDELKAEVLLRAPARRVFWTKEKIDRADRDAEAMMKTLNFDRKL